MSTLEQKLPGYKGLLVLLAVWLCSMIAIDISGEFPLNDDFSYAKAAFALASQGKFMVTDWTCMTLVTQVVIGAAVAKVFGLSFFALRLITTAASVSGIIAFYSVFSILGRSSKVALMAAACLAFNPIYYSLSATFMTDVLGLSLSLWTVFFFLSYRKSRTTTNLILTCLLGILATLLRQDSIVLLLGLAIANALNWFLSGSPREYRLHAVLGAAPLAISWIALKLFDYGFPLINEGGMPTYYSGFGSVSATIQANGIEASVKSMVAQVIQALFYGGLFVAPFACAMKVTDARMRRLYVFSFAASLLLAAALCLSGQGMPMGGNILHRAGVGPMLFLDLETGHHDHFPELWSGIYFLGTYLSSCGVVCLLLTGCNALESFVTTNASPATERDDKFDYCLGLTIGLLWLALSGIKMSNFDRHFLLLVLPTCVLLTRFCREFAVARFAAVVLCFATYSVPGTHDYLAANRAKLQAYNYLRQDMGIPPEEIDAGIELNGFYLFSGKLPRESKVKFWFAKGDRFLLTLGPMAGYKVVKSFEFSRWLAHESRQVEILEKLP
ncbi:MAG: glycosyltransferase family 39 protein [Candidatus Obscuribacterales bacterium]|nr:glycosyltransferase family 39 protein [Candidatus Obscuribacterales bacterium]